MAELSFETLGFSLRKGKLKVHLLRSWATEIPLKELHAIGEFTLKDPHTLQFDCEQDKAELKFSYLLEKYLPNLKTKLTGNPCTYIHRHSGIPLIGNVSFGIVYRNSSIIEIKTNNGCNLDCVYCSISEGLSSTKHDFVIEKDYLVEELSNLIQFVGEPVEVHIGVQGEPFIYGDMVPLIEDLQNHPMIHTISIDTNGTLITKDMLKRLIPCDKLQFNLSLDAIDPEMASIMAGTKTYKVKHILKTIESICENFKTIIAPVFTPGFNKDEMEKIIKFVKTLPKQPILGIQNFLPYKTGRNPKQQMSWDEFYAMLEKLEKKHKIKLKLHKDDFNITKTKPLPKPFALGDKIKATIKCPDRFPNSILAVAKGRNISVPGVKYVKDKKISIQIVRDKHNVFVGKLLK